MNCPLLSLLSVSIPFVMSGKRKRGNQVAERSSLGAKVDSLGTAMPVPCTHCLLLKERGEIEEVNCRVALGFSRCGECCRRGRSSCDASGLEDSDCAF